MKKFKKWLRKLRYGEDPFEGYTFTQPFIGLITQPPGEEQARIVPPTARLDDAERRAVADELTAEAQRLGLDY